MADKPTPKKRRVSAGGRQDGDYAPPILAEPQGGPIPVGPAAEVQNPAKGA